MHLTCRDRTLDVSRPVIMGVVNATPDSFSDGGELRDLDARVARCVEMVEHGAGVLDIGGQSAITGVPEISVGEEIDRLAAEFSRDPGVISWPEKDIKRLMKDEDWDFGPNIKARAEQVLAEGGLPEYPEEMVETFEKLMNEHGIDTSKYLA